MGSRVTTTIEQAHLERFGMGGILRALESLFLTIPKVPWVGVWRCISGYFAWAVPVAQRWRSSGEKGQLSLSEQKT